jgi:hypothetical protein
MRFKSVISVLALTTIFGQGLMVANKVEAQSMFDLNALTCKELLLSDSEDRTAILSLFHGFFNGKNNQTVMDTAKAAMMTDKILSHCADNSQKTVMSVFEEYWNKD